MKGFRKVLIALNGNRKVLDAGIQMAQDEKTWAIVIKVIPPFEGDLNLTGIKNIEDVLDSGVGSAVSQVAADAKAKGALIKTTVRQGNVPDAIVEVADEERCDLIIMGAPKKNRLRRFFGDHAVEKVIDMAPCPVYVVAA
ncbi:MAG TPA: universal stress protein [Dissulfurispiraceae bacterium]|nr:universal stress protein [Dissulfurispiraceae bacterium]